MKDLEQILIRKHAQLAKAKDYGIDIVTLFDNLKRTPTERIRRLQVALNTYQRFRKPAQGSTNSKASDNLLYRLTQAGLDYAIIGDFAAAIHGCRLHSQQIDICCDFSVGNLLRLQKALADLNPVHRMTPNKLKLELTKENCKDFKNLYLDTDLGQLDCVGYVQGLGSFDKVKTESESVVVDDRRYNVLRIDALISSKKALKRAKDAEAIAQLEAIQHLKPKKTGEQSS